jgi:hypothetical protein
MRYYAAKTLDFVRHFQINKSGTRHFEISRVSLRFPPPWQQILVAVKWYLTFQLTIYYKQRNFGNKKCIVFANYAQGRSSVIKNHNIWLTTAELKS